MQSMDIKANDAPPQVADVNFADPSFLADPWSAMVRLQHEAPVYYGKNQGGWIISRFEDVKAAFTDRRLLASRVAQLYRNMPPEIYEKTEAVRLYTGLIVNRLDGRDHIRIRALLVKAFNKSTVDAVAEILPGLIDEILDECERLGEFDFVRVASELPTRVMQKLMGITDEYRPLLLRLADNFSSASAAAALTPELLLQLDQSIREMNDVFNELIPQREKNPGDDLISTLVHARDGLSKLSHDELLAQLHGLNIAGAETTTHSLSAQLTRIARDPELTRIVREQPERMFDLVAELLRYPGTVKCMTRYAGEDLEIGGQQIAKGDLLWIMHAGANIDAEKWENPFTIDIDRENARDSMAFGPGLHFCVGHLLARTELAEFFTRAFARFDIEILQDEIEMVPSYIFYGYKSLRVRFTPRTA